MTEPAIEIPQSTADSLVMAAAMLHDAQMGCEFLPVEHPLREAARDCAAAANVAIERLIAHGGADALTRVISRAYEFGMIGAQLLEDETPGDAGGPKLSAAELKALGEVVNAMNGFNCEHTRFTLAGLLARSQPLSIPITAAEGAAGTATAPQSAPLLSPITPKPDDSALSSSP